MVHRIGVASAFVATVFALAAPGGAVAATTVGETFGGLVDCGASTRLQSVSPGGQYAAPFAGVITQWSFLADGSPPTQMKLKVGRSAGGNDFTIVGESGLSPIAPGILNSFSTRISVIAGDVIGMYPSTSGHCAQTGQSGYTSVFKSVTDVPPMTTTTFAPESNVKNDISALLEADADHDGFGDETQDQCLGTTGPQNGCPAPVAAPTGQRAAALKKCKKKAKKKHWTKKKLKKCKKKARKLPV